MAFIVVYDACVLYPAHVRDFLLRLALTGLFQAKWSEDILDEAFTAIIAKHPGLTDRLARTRERMNEAIRDGIVTGYEHLIDGLELPDPDDRHVLAAAIRSNAQVIVTFNTSDFPEGRLELFDVEAQTPDEFVCDLIDLDRGTVLRVFRDWIEGLRHTPRSSVEILDVLERDGLPRTAALLRRLLEGG